MPAKTKHRSRKATDEREHGRPPLPIMKNDPVISRIHSERGLRRKLADHLGLASASGVGSWKRVPAEHVAKVSAFLRMAKQHIRPDLFPSN